MAEKETGSNTDIADLKQGKQDAITFGTRAPHSKDVGNIWVKYTKNNDSSMDLYVRHPVTGTWRKVTAS
jgi:hypothetical protein